MKMQELSVDEAAARWRLRLLDAGLSAEDRQAFEHWLAASPANRAAYEAMGRAWDAAGEEAGDADIREMREAALRFQAPAQRRPTARMAMAAAATLAVAAGLWFAMEKPWLDAEDAAAGKVVSEGQFSTAVGERSTVRLSDGSVVTLNTASRMQLDLAGPVREVRLLEGQAIFEVAQDKTRPFVVFAGDRRITALGTAFDVRIEKREVRVTLVDGKVAVDQLSGGTATHESATSPGVPPARTQLEPGEQLVASLGGAATVQGANVGRITSWREGRLIFEADRLADALAEMNRYAESPIVLADAAIGELRVSGVFRTGQPAAFAGALEKYFPLQVAVEGGTTVLRWRR